MDTERLRECFVAELLAIPLDQWGFFFPFLVGLWRYIESEYPGTLGELRCGYGDEPYFEGSRAEWFVSIVNEQSVLDPIERLAYATAAALGPNTRSRGFVAERRELPALNAPDLQEIASGIHRSVARV